MAALVGAPSLVCVERTLGLASSSLTGEKVRVNFSLQCAATPLRKGLQVLALKDGKSSHGEKPWDTQRAFLGVKESATETNAVATTDFVVGKTFGYTMESDEEEDEDAEVLHVDNESMDDGDQLDISRLGIPAAVVAALESRGITQLFPIQVTGTLSSGV